MEVPNPSPGSRSSDRQSTSHAPLAPASARVSLDSSPGLAVKPSHSAPAGSGPRY